MDLGIAGRKAIVCASSRGLGRACAFALAQAGCEVVINGRDGKTLDATAAELRQATGAKVAANRTEGYLHGLARIFNAAMKAGLTIRGFREGDRVPWKALDQLVQVDRDYWALPEGVPYVPLHFILEAVKES